MSLLLIDCDDGVLIIQRIVCDECIVNCKYVGQWYIVMVFVWFFVFEEICYLCLKVCESE